MAETLVEKYQGTTKLYLSWDAASWHMSKKLLAFVETHNAESLSSTVDAKTTLLPTRENFYRPSSEAKLLTTPVPVSLSFTGYGRDAG